LTRYDFWVNWGEEKRGRSFGMLDGWAFGMGGIVISLDYLTSGNAGVRHSWTGNLFHAG